MVKGYEVYINNVPLHDFVLITGIKRDILPSRENQSKGVSARHGSYYQGFTYKEREVRLTCFLEASNKEERVEGMGYLVDILNVKDPVKIVCSDEPNVHFYAVPEITSQERFRDNEEIEITLTCFDIYKYANEDDFFQPDSRRVVEVVNGGSVEAFPVTSVEFTKDAHFLQCTSYTGETVLIGQRPDIEKPSSTGDITVLSDDCGSMANWLPAGNVVESDYKVMGTAQVNAGGYGIICNDYGTSSEGWHGVALRRNIGSNVRDFYVEVTLEHNSQGDVKGTGSSTVAPASSKEYVINAEPSLRIRQARNTSSAILGKIPKGKKIAVTEISNNWGKVTYNGVTGYIDMNYTTVYTAPVVETYTIQSTDRVNIRSGAGTSHKILTTVNKGVTATAKSNETVNGWYKVTVNGKTGYTSSKYWKKVKTTKKRNARTSTPSAENRVGRIEVYGFGKNQERLFKFTLRDSEQWHEYTQPEVFIGSHKVLYDDKPVPTIQTSSYIDANGNKITTHINSGRYGDWNEFYGKFYVRRQTNEKGQQTWKVTVDKVVGHNTVKRITSSVLINDKYPTADLNNIVVYFGQYKDLPVVDVMNIQHVRVDNLVPYTPQENRPIFRAGDEVLINHNNNKVYVNGRLRMDDLDIGSQFFSVPTGSSAFVIATDDENADVEVGLTKRYL